MNTDLGSLERVAANDIKGRRLEQKFDGFDVVQPQGDMQRRFFQNSLQQKKPTSFRIY